MFSRIFSGIRNSTNAPVAAIPRQQQSRLSLEDSSEELVKVTRIIPSNNVNSTAAMTLPAIFGLSNNITDDFIQKDLISTSLY